MPGVFGLIDGLNASVARLTAIEQRVRPPVPSYAATYFPRTRLGSPGWLEDFIKDWVGPLADLYVKLQETGIITPGQAAAGLSKEELIALIRDILEEKKPWWESPWLPVAISVGVVGGAAAYYVAKKPRK